MPNRMRQVGREVGAAVAVLALYILVLLAPLHQSAGLQRELARLGFESSASWSVCTSVANPAQGDTGTPTAAKCPVTGVGKSQFAAVLPPVARRRCCDMPSRFSLKPMLIPAQQSRWSIWANRAPAARRLIHGSLYQPPSGTHLHLLYEDTK